MGYMAVVKSQVLDSAIDVQKKSVWWSKVLPHFLSKSNSDF